MRRSSEGPGHLVLSEDDNGLHFPAQLDRSEPDAQSLMRKLGSGLFGSGFLRFSRYPPELE
jgi:hypothetical protein